MNCSNYRFCNRSPNYLKLSIPPDGFPLCVLCASVVKIALSA